MWDLENNAFPVTGQGYQREIEAAAALRDRGGRRGLTGTMAGPRPVLWSGAETGTSRGEARCWVTAPCNAGTGRICALGACRVMLV